MTKRGYQVKSQKERRCLDRVRVRVGERSEREREKCGENDFICKRKLKLCEYPTYRTAQVGKFEQKKGHQFIIEGEV